jgi:YVTN family beta-propeller protein
VTMLSRFGRPSNRPERKGFAVIAAGSVLWVLALCWTLRGASQGDNLQYLSPGEIAISPDGSRLYVTCEASNELRIVDTRTGAILKSVSVGRVPRGLALSPDGSRVYVTNSWDDNITVVDATGFAVLRTLRAGWEPTSVVTDLTGKNLYVANRLSDDISVIDVATANESKRIPAGRGASYLARAGTTPFIHCSHVYPSVKGARRAPESQMTVIESSRQAVTGTQMMTNAAGVFHIAFSPDGRLGVVAHLRPKNLLPLAHVEHGWAFGDSLLLFGADVPGTISVPLDEIDRYFAMPFGVAITPDKSKIYVSTSGSDSVTVISVSRLLTFASARGGSFANDLSASSNYVVARIAVGRNPRGIALSPDGKRLYVANRLDDTIGVIDTGTDSIIATLDLGGPRHVTALRRGEQLFNSAAYAFQGQFGCANCHIDATYDGLQWDLEPDGFGRDIVDNRSIEDLGGTEPFKWNGQNPDLPTECGPRTEKYIYRSQSYSPKELADLTMFVLSIPARPNRYRLADGTLTAAQLRGKAVFERTRYKTGRPIPRHNQCAYCHLGPKYTNQKLTYVGTLRPLDNSEMLDVPHLTNVAYSAPYLHDGSAATLEELWTVFNPNDTHGVTSDLTKAEINDLVEYLKSL